MSGLVRQRTLPWSAHGRAPHADTPRTGGQIQNDDLADDVKNVDLTKVHYLSGPFEVEGAEPGDLLLVEIMDVQPFEDRPWGFTGIFDRRNGVCPRPGAVSRGSKLVVGADSDLRAASPTRSTLRRMSVPLLLLFSQLGVLTRLQRQSNLGF